MTFEYRNAANDRLAVAPLGDVVWLKTTPGGCEVPPDRAEEVVAGIRDAARQAAGQTTTPEGFTWTLPPGPAALRCNWAHTQHAHTPHDWEPQPGMQAVRCPGHATPAVEQPAEAQRAEAHPPREQWRVELYDPLAKEWAPGAAFTSRKRAEERLRMAQIHSPRWAQDETPVERRLVRETTTWTVEEDLR